MSKIRATASLLVLGLLSSVAAAAIHIPAASAMTTLTVNDTADLPDVDFRDGACRTATGTCTLRAAVAHAKSISGAVVIRVPAGTYNLSRMIESWDKELTIIGAGPAHTVIDGGGTNRLFRFFNTGNETFGLQSMTLRRGNDATEWQYGGGAVHGDFGFLDLADVFVTDNHSRASGGAIIAPYVRVSDSRFTGNTARHNGGAIATATLEAYFSHLTVLNSHFEGNRADRDGGSISTQRLQLDRSEITGSVAGDNGGAISALGGWIRQSTITGSSALLGDGGGLHVPGGDSSIWVEFGLRPEFPIENSTFSANEALRGRGGALVVIPDPAVEVQLISTTVVDNAAVLGGGFSAVGANRTSVTDTVLADNSGGDCGGTLPTMVTTNHDTDGSCMASSTGNPQLSPLRDNGGPTLTHEPRPGSPLIDAGGTDCPSRDQRLQARPTDGDGDGSFLCDIGSVEADGPTSSTEPLCDRDLMPWCDEFELPPIISKPIIEFPCLADGPGCWEFDPNWHERPKPFDPPLPPGPAGGF